MLKRTSMGLGARLNKKTSVGLRSRLVRSPARLLACAWLVVPSACIWRVVDDPRAAVTRSLSIPSPPPALRVAGGHRGAEAHPGRMVQARRAAHPSGLLGGLEPVQVGLAARANCSGR